MYIKYLEKLISFKSITPLSAGSIEYISNLLKDHGFKITVKLFGKNNYQVTNLYAVYGNERPNICFVGHVDVVPACYPNLWYENPFLATIIDDKIYGRGVVDMKGAIACFLSASLDFIKLHPKFKGSISFLITSDEEGEAIYGTREMLQYLHQTDSSSKIDFAIVGEPTSEQKIGDTIKIGRRGSINFHLFVYGVQGHVAYPHEANNPVSHLVTMIYNLINYKLDEGNKFFQSSNIEITSIDVNNKILNIIPAKASARFNIRFNDLHIADDVIKLIKQNIEEYCLLYKLNYKLNSKIVSSSFIQEPVGLIADFVQIVTEDTGIIPTLSTSGGTSDARFVKNYCPVVEFGLLSATAHKTNEHTKVTDLQKLYQVYYNSLIKFLG